MDISNATSKFGALALWISGALLAVLGTAYDLEALEDLGGTFMIACGVALVTNLGRMGTGFERYWQRAWEREILFRSLFGPLARRNALLIRWWSGLTMIFLGAFWIIGFD